MAAKRFQAAKDNLMKQAFGASAQIASTWKRPANPMTGLMGSMGQLGGARYGQKQFGGLLQGMGRPGTPQTATAGASSGARAWSPYQYGAWVPRGPMPV